MVAGKQRFFFPQSITNMICHMAGGGDGFKCPVCTIDNVAIGHNMVGFKGVICVFRGAARQKFLAWAAGTRKWGRLCVPAMGCRQANGQDGYA